MPKRVLLSRKRGWRMPPNTVKVDRSTNWGNPFKIGDPHPDHGQPITREEAMDLFRSLLNSDQLDHEYPVNNIKNELCSKNLACWCALNELTKHLECPLGASQYRSQPNHIAYYYYQRKPSKFQWQHPGLIDCALARQIDY